MNFIAWVRRRWMLSILLALAVTVVAAAIAGTYLLDDYIEQRLDASLRRLMRERFDSEVELRALDVRFMPTLAIEGHGLTLRYQGRTDIPPLIRVERFSIASSVLELRERHIDRVELEGLEIVIPPGRGAQMPGGESDRTPDGPDEPEDAGNNGRNDVWIHEIVSERARLTITPKRPDKRPKSFELFSVRLEEFQFRQPTRFHAQLSNPTPAGRIDTSGTFGPWQRDDPARTPLDGGFTFDADLGSIKGIGGQLHAEGRFTGPLEEIRTSGRTRTPDFHLKSGAAKFPLEVDYDAIVDGTSGDTYLTRVDATLGPSRIAARGSIVDVKGVPGRRITLETSVTQGRLEDFIRLATRVRQSPLTGLVDVKATLDIPPGDVDVIEKMDLGGAFSVARARFTSDAIQDRIDELSRKGQGRPKDEQVVDVASDLRGEFRLHDSRLTLRSMTFGVPGADVRIAGYYGITSDVLDFDGVLRLRASVSQTMTGWKSWVMKPFDGLFRKRGAGTRLAITIGGTREEPKFGMDLGRTLKGK